jgi:hypothetical protein
MRLPARSTAALLALAGCATGPASTERTLDAAPAVVLERVTIELRDLGFSPETGGPGSLLATTTRADPAWATCSPVLVGDGDDRRLMASAERRDAQIRVTATAVAGRTDLSVGAEFRAGYRNRLRAAGFERACRSTGVLEARLLEAGGG